MKKKYFLFLFFIMNQLFAQADFDLVKMFNINSNVYTHERIWLEDNTFLVPISFNTQTYTLENGVVITNPNYQPGQNSFKMLIARYNENAQLVNYFTLNSIGFEQLADITIGKNDEIYLTYIVPVGYQLDGQTYFANSTQAASKYMMIKMSKGGNIMWKKTFEGGDLMMFNLAIANNGDVFMTARSSQQDIKVDGIIYTNPTPHQTKPQLTRMVVGKLNTSGNGMVWLNSSSNSINENFSSIFVFNNRQQIIKLDSQNNVYLVGTLFGSKASFGSTVIQNIGTNIEKLFMVKYNANGQMQWAKSPTVSNNSLRIAPVQFEIDQQDNLFLLDDYHPGFNGTVTVNYWGHSYSVNKAFCTLFKMNTNGDVVWSKKPQVLNQTDDYFFSLQYFKLEKDKLLAFGIFKGNFDYGNGIEINTNNEYKWVSFEFNKQGGIDNYYTVNTSLNVFPMNFIGMDNQNRFWFAQKTAYSNGVTNHYIGTLNFTVPSPTSGNQKLLYFRSTQVTLGTKYFEKINLNIYPNPTKGILNLTGEDLENKSYQIFDLSGKIILFGKIDNTLINVETLNSGIYLLKVYDRDDSRKNITLKFKKI